MGNRFSKKDDQTQNKIRRVYVGNDCPRIDEDDSESPLGKNEVLERKHSFTVPDPSEEPVLAKPVAVRRQSIVGPLPKLKLRNNYPNNLIRSSRYTAWTFLPKNLFEQFRRIVNFYFFVVAIVQSVTPSPVSEFTAVLPLIFVIFVTMVKQGYEDLLRHSADDLFNNRPVQVIHDGVIETIKSKDIRVGDIIKLEAGQQVPTDLLFIGSSDEFQRCQINTANLDGETNLKMRYCPAGLPHFRDETDFINFNLAIECEQPCADLYNFNGNILIPQYGPPRQHSSLTTVPEEGETTEPSNEPLNTNEQRRKSNKNLSFSHSNEKIETTKSGTSSWGHPQIPIGVFYDWLQVCIGMENMVLRGTRLKNTEYIYGIVLYTGPDTRLAKNSDHTSPKFSTVEKSVNKYLFVFIIILVILVVIAMTLAQTVNWYAEKAWYLGKPERKNEVLYYFNNFAAFLVLFNYIIPISLYVTMEMQKFFGSKYFVWDEDMAADNGEPALCNTSDLNEELGQIEYLFSDKTGTLTENVMKFRICCIDSNRYDYENEQLYIADVMDQSKRTLVQIEDSPPVLKFLKSLALCHSVQLMHTRRASVEGTEFELFTPKKKKKVSSKVKNANSLFTIGNDSPEPVTFGVVGNKWEYQGNSPDEKALVDACSLLGIIYMGEDEDRLQVDSFGHSEYFKRHLVLEFDSNRKCMSVVVENEAGEIWVITKGADSTVTAKCDYGPTQATNKHVSGFAQMGLRTLVIAERQITRSELNDYISRLKAARRLIHNREDTIRGIYREIESHLTTIGATGVEDQLQEGVQHTLAALGAAGIRVWMLTGDKLETGENVAVSCGLIANGTTRYYLTDLEGSTRDSLVADLKKIRDKMEDGDNTVFIVDGEALAVTLVESPDILCEVAMRAFRVVCVRMTPLQKAQVVRMVRNTPGNPITAAVGDGANDVAMIQEAHIGIGILGKEGRQAARCADFAVAKFGYLKKAILVHGHWYYVRLANIANYFFYKNILFILPQIFYCFHSSFSTQALFDGIFLMMYNIFYTACPILFYGFVEQPYSSKVLLENPYLYKEIRHNALMTPGIFIKWSLFAMWHGSIVYWFVYFSWSAFQPLNDLSSFGTVVFCGIVAVANMKILLETKFICCFTVGTQIYSYVALFMFTSIYSEVDLSIFGVDAGQFRHVYFTLQSQLVFWLVMLLVTFTSITPDLVWKGIENSWDSVSRFARIIPLRVKLRRLNRKKMGFPKVSLLFSKRTGNLTISSATMNSYISKENL